MSTETIQNNEVASRAHLLWEQAGRPQGRDLEFWIQAEAEVCLAAGANHKDLGVDSTASPIPAVPSNRTGAAPKGVSQSRTKQPAVKGPRRGPARS
ncbi:MAG: DUF2934 domain-containing protein [Verrucomicrobiota bacterium]